MSNEHHGRQYKQEIDLALKEMLDYQVEVAQQRVESGTVSEEAHANFERAVMTMRRRLLPYAGDVEDYWVGANIDAIPQLCAKIVEEEDGVDDFGLERGTQTRVEHAPVDYLEAWSDELLNIYSRLGFSPDVELGQIEARGEYADVLD